MESQSFWLHLSALLILSSQQAEGYTYRNQRKFSEDIDWSYAGTLNQKNWAKKFPSCSSAKQSPINIEENLAPVKLQYQKLKFDGWERLTADRTTIRNNGKTVAVNVDGEFYVSGGGLRSKFKVGGITFHWGRCNASSEGSEHSLDGVKYPLEMQIYCYEAHQFDSLDEAIEARGRMAALAVFFQTSTEDNMEYAAIIDSINSVSRYGKSAEVLPFTMQGLLPNSTEKYFIYNGSLTTPPCSETVEWIVFKDRVTISDEQLEMFCEVMTMQQAGYVMLMDYLQNNYREQQEQFMGQVFSSYTGNEEVQTPVCSSEPENLQATPYNLSSLLVTWERPRAVYDANIERYSITYQVASAEEPLEYLTDGYQDTGAIIDDLLANTTYEIQVVSVCTNSLYGQVSDSLTVVMPVLDAENVLDPSSDELTLEDRHRPASSWNEPEQTRSKDLDSVKTTTSASPFPPRPGLRTTAESRQRPTAGPGPSLKSLPSSEVRSGSRETAQRGDPSQEVTAPPETRGNADFSNNKVFYSTTTEQTIILTSAAPSLTNTTTEEVHGERDLKSEQADHDKETVNPVAPYTNTQGAPGYVSTTTAASLPTGRTSAASSSSFIQAETDQGLSKVLGDDTSSDYTAPPGPSGRSDAHESTSTLQTFSSSPAEELTSPSMPLFPSAAPSVLRTHAPPTGEHLSVSPSSSSFASLLSDALEPSAEPCACLHDPSFSEPVLSASVLDSKHAATPPPSIQDLVSPSAPVLLASTLPHLPHPSHPLSVWETDSFHPSVSPGYGDENSVGVGLSGSSGGPSVFGVTPPLRTAPLLSVAAERSEPSWDLSLSETSLSLTPTLQPLVLLSSEFTLSDVTPGSSKTVSFGFEDSRYATGSTIETLLPDVSGDGFSLASDVDIMCGCSLEPSASSSWLHASLHVPLLSSPRDSTSLELYSSVGLFSASGVGADDLPPSAAVVGSDGPSLDQALHSQSNVSPSSSSPQLLQVTHSDLFVLVAASGRNTSLHMSSLPPSPAASPSAPAPEGQLFDSSSSSSGSALLPDSQEGVDQERDRVQIVASGEGVRSYSAISTTPLVSTVESGHNPDDLDEHSSAFYFESGSGVITEVGDIGTSAVSEVTSAPAWSLGGTEESGSGQGEGLYDNETSSDFSISERSDRESVEEEPAADVSNSSHESRVGSVMEREKKVVVPLAVISSLTVLGLVVLVGLLIYWRMCFQTAHFYIGNSSSPGVIAAQATSDEETAFTLKDFVQHVAELHSAQGFQREFQILKESYKEVQACMVDMAMTTDSSEHPDNQTKNRYSNILAYDHSRVRLSSQADKDGKKTDYINANYVDGFQRPRSYIATQGPLTSSIQDFWRMVWEQNVGVIVMITNLMENGRRKCDQYWPVEVQEEYGSFLVSVKSTKVLAYYTQRTFTVRKISMKKGSQKGPGSERTVTQYQYTQWPDMGVPEFPLPLLSFVCKSSQARTGSMGPLVVHCSAGVGRTGTYVVLDSMLKQMKSDGTVNIAGFLKHIRTQRNDLVQTEEQYVFIHDALVEAVLSGETEVTADRLHKYMEELLTPGPAGRTRLDKQFKLVCHYEMKKGDFAAALQDCNLNKNRDRSVIPAERSRVCLSTTAGETSDYINASHIAGYRRRTEFIITQKPLPSTTKDFWKMIWEHNAQVIVSLPGTRDEAEPCLFWPRKEQPITCGMLTVTQRSETHICLSNEDMLVVHEYSLETAQDDYVLEVKHYHSLCWPNPDGPISQTFELISLVTEQSAGKEGPVVVHDDVGGVTAGTFCALSTLRQQLDAEGSVDVFKVARMTNLMRPGVFRDTEDFQFLYKAMLSLIGAREDENTLRSHDDGAIVVGGAAAAAAESLESLV